MIEEGTPKTNKVEHNREAKGVPNSKEKLEERSPERRSDKISHKRLADEKSEGLKIMHQSM